MDGVLTLLNSKQSLKLAVLCYRVSATDDLYN